MDRRSRRSRLSVSNQNGHIHVVDNVDRDLSWNRSRDGNVDIDLHRVLHDTGDRDGNCDRHLNLDGTLNLLGNNHFVRARNRNGHSVGHANSLVDWHRAGNTNCLHFLDGDDHRAVLGDGVGSVHFVLPGLDNIDWYGDLNFLHDLFHSLVRLGHSHFLGYSLRLIHWHLHLVRNHLVHRHNDLYRARHLDLVHDLNCFRNIHGLGLGHFYWVRHVNWDLHRHSNCNWLGHWNLLRHANGHGNLDGHWNCNRHGNGLSHWNLLRNSH